MESTKRPMYTSTPIIHHKLFEMREKCIQEHKQARRERDSMGKEIWTGFRAKPALHFINSLGNKNKNQEVAKPQMQIMEKSNIVEMMKINNAAKIWKKKAFQPILPKKKNFVPKSPKLSTVLRARERKRFEDRLQEKRLQEQARLKMEEAERKKREQEEIAELRKRLVHKAQPIRIYKTLVPREKRPLTDPAIPIICKRRRISKNP